MSEQQKAGQELSKVGGAAAIAGLLGLGAYGIATQIAPEPYAGLSLWLALPAYALAYWIIVPALRRRYGPPFQRR